jgi:hypothetical protein
MSLVTRLWFDETGAVLTVELVIILTVLVMALVVGITALRDALVTELGDTAAGIGSLNQSYSFGGIIGHCAFTAGSFFTDLPDTDVDDPDPDDGTVSGIIVCSMVATPEGGQLARVTTDRGSVTFQEDADGDGMNVSIEN